MRIRSIAVVLFAVVLAGMAQGWSWYFTFEKIAPPDVRAVRSVSFSPYTRDQNPTTGSEPAIETIRSDLDVVSRMAAGVRTYAVTGGLEQVPLEAVMPLVALWGAST
ncbi:MAG: hypothetical protein HQL33_09965, partial [Alphaproteobacteria bacterium]|nr:hypothetical protein [Alphaproteobacteria bacterium]